MKNVTTTIHEWTAFSTWHLCRRLPKKPQATLAAVRFSITERASRLFIYLLRNALRSTQTKKNSHNLEKGAHCCTAAIYFFFFGKMQEASAPGELLHTAPRTFYWYNNFSGARRELCFTMRQARAHQEKWAPGIHSFSPRDAQYLTKERAGESAAAFSARLCVHVYTFEGGLGFWDSRAGGC